jgi:hypothetical protein
VRSYGSVLVVCVGLSAASPARADDAVPPGSHVERHVRRPLIVAGIVLEASAWVLTGLVSGLAESDHYGGIPVVGPYLSWAHADPKDIAPSFWALSAAVQTAAVAMIVCGIVLKRDVVVPDAHATLAPMLLAHGEGLAIVGEF